MKKNEKEKFEEFLKQYKGSEKIVEEAMLQMIITGQVELKITDDNKIEIVNPFKGCNCED
jgi:DNA-binding TFAR19-related protein (PDSD5 family)